MCHMTSRQRPGNQHQKLDLQQLPPVGGSTTPIRKKTATPLSCWQGKFHKDQGAIARQAPGPIRKFMENSQSSWYHQHISLQGRGGEVCRRWPRPLACRWQPQQKQSMWYMNIIEYTWCIQAPLLRIATKQCLSKFPEDPAKATAGKVRHAKTVRKACKPQIWRVQRCATFWCKCG